MTVKIFFLLWWYCYNKWLLNSIKITLIILFGSYYMLHFKITILLTSLLIHKCYFIYEKSEPRFKKKNIAGLEL